MSKRRWTMDPYQAEIYIYNDISSDKLISDLYPDETSRVEKSLENEKDEVDAFIESITLEEEEWKTVSLQTASTPFIVSSKGRLISAYRGLKLRQVRVATEEGIVITDSGNNKIPLEDLMIEAGYDYDLETILKFYAETDYPVMRWLQFAKDIVAQ